ncbi:MAG TPA: hypothetical protein VN132_10625 [Bdellovibrio sp.]|nr:hypothetical protein [Bdellovibrio sp.]
MKIRGFSELKSFLEKDKSKIKGCLVDTSVLFAASYTPDKYNEECEKPFDELAKRNIPVFTNVSVKHEFLERQRRVLVADSLVVFYEIYGKKLPPTLEMKLKSHKTSHQKKADEEKPTGLQKQQIDSFSKQLRSISIDGRNAWDILCQDLFAPQLLPVWDKAVQEFRIVELKTRTEDASPFILKNPDWDDAVKLMGRYCLGSTDAMIINMFLCSAIPVMLTADFEMARTAVTENQSNKEIFIPDSL